MSNAHLRLRAPILLPGLADDTFSFLPDAALLTDAQGRIDFVGPFASRPPSDELSYARAGLLIPPLLDCHIHVPQHPIRGKFVEGVRGDEPEGPLLAGLKRNVFPAEMRCADDAYARGVVAEFLRETREKGTHGGVAYMTAHPAAARIALEMLPPTWRLGLVLMDQNCPEGLHIDVPAATRALDGLARDFGQRLVVTDRFAVACSSPLRKAGVEIARKYSLETQTHLAEQPGELAAVKLLYPWAKHYTHVYERDGLLGPGALLAHCIHMREDEWETLARHRSRVAHCPVSNTLLRSGVMPLDEVYAHGLDYALCTDVGASPTTSLLCEMTHFVGTHTSARATPATALWRTTVGAARVGKLFPGSLTKGHPFAATEIRAAAPLPSTADEVIRAALLGAPHASVESIAAEVSGRVSRLWHPS